MECVVDEPGLSVCLSMCVYLCMSICACMSKCACVFKVECMVKFGQLILTTNTSLACRVLITLANIPLKINLFPPAVQLYYQELIIVVNPNPNHYY